MQLSFTKLKPYLPIFFILLLAAFLRFWRIGEYLTFLGDEGRDALVWLHMARDGKFTLIGPRTSIGDMYLGPLYYYLMFPLFLFEQSPVGPAAGVGLLSLLTTFLLYKIGQEWFGEKAGLVASFLFAISPVVVTYSRSSWNPNIMPFCALLSAWGIWQVWEKKKFFWLVIVSVSLSFVLQSHYLGLLLLPFICLFWFLTFLELKKEKGFFRFLVFSFFGFFVFWFLTIAPLVWFDLRHNFLNFHSFQRFFGDRQTTVNFKLYKAAPNLWPLWEMLVTRLLAAKEILLGRILAIGLLGCLIYFWRKIRSRRAVIFLSAWLLLGLGGMGLYKQHIYDHYFGLLFPVPFLFIGSIFEYLWREKPYGRILFSICFLPLVFFNLKNSHLWYAPNNQLNRVQAVDKKILEEANGRPFNFALIAKQNYEDGYTFYLELWQKKPWYIDAQRLDETLADQLFVVCEDPVCEPINHPKAEIAMFGWSKIEKEWTFPWGVKLFRLVHTQQ